METKLFCKIIDELAYLGWKGRIQPHHCGEPLLDDRIADLIAYAKKKIPEIQVEFFTNGELLSLDSYKRLIKAGVSKFFVTQHLPVQSKGVLEILEHRSKLGSGNIEFKYDRLHVISNWGGEVKVYQVNRKTLCDWPMHNIGIDYAGNVLMCCWDYSNKVKIGNMNKQKLIDIWNKPSYRKLRNEIQSGVFKLDICKKCAYDNQQH